jgi:hypothetical protein
VSADHVVQPELIEHSAKAVSRQLLQQPRMLVTIVVTGLAVSNTSWLLVCACITFGLQCLDVTVCACLLQLVLPYWVEVPSARWRLAGVVALTLGTTAVR